jgi:hypothetical protein
MRPNAIVHRGTERKGKEKDGVVLFPCMTWPAGFQFVHMHGFTATM